MIDRYRTTVLRPGVDEPLRIVSIYDIQPEGTGQVYARLRNRDWTAVDDRPRLCALRDGRWHDTGPAPDARDESWHPDLPENLATYVEVARRTIARIPECAGADVYLSYVRTGSSDSFQSEAMFNLVDGQDSDSPCGPATDEMLDHIPMVRFVERGGIRFQEFLKIEGYDDASGYQGEFQLNITPTSLSLIHGSEDEEDSILELSSSFEGGEWKHRTIVSQSSYQETNPIERLRIEGDPQRYAESHFAKTHWAKKGILLGDPIVKTILFEDSAITVEYEPSSLLHKRKDKTALAA